MRVPIVISRRVKVLVVVIVMVMAAGSIVHMQSWCLRMVRRYGDDYLAKQPYPLYPLSEQELAPVRQNPEWSSDPFEVAPGATLDGIVHTPKAADRPWVLYFHGATGNGLRDAIRDYERFGLDWGFAAWTYRGYGASTGATTKETLRSDAVRMAERLFTKWHVAPGRLRLYGFSFGTAPATHAGMVLSQQNETPAGAVFASTGFRQGSRLRSLLYDVTSETRRRDAIRCPILITHGLFDTAHRFEAALEDFAALKQVDAELLVVRAGHDHAVMPQAARRIREFIEQPDARKVVPR